MGLIKISAKGIDELNGIYRKLKQEYKALGNIKLNHETMEYEMELLKNDLDRSLQAICDKVIDADDLMDDAPSVFKDFTWKRLNDQLKNDQVVLPLRPLKAVWKDLTEEKQLGCFNYLCEEMEIQPKGEPEYGSKLSA